MNSVKIVVTLFNFNLNSRLLKSVYDSRINMVYFSAVGVGRSY